MNNQQKAAIQIANQIEEMLLSKRILARTKAPIQAGDILVLVQARSNLVHALITQLNLRQIPNTGIDRLKLNNDIAIWDMLAVAQFICNHDDDMSLACILASPLFAIDYQHITNLCYHRGEKTLLQHIMQNDEDAHLQQKLLRLIELAQTHLMPSHFFTHLLYGEDYIRQFTKRLGEGMNDLLHNLIYQVENYEKAHLAPNLYDFVRWFRMAESEVKRDLDDGLNKVRIMTVHGSKGLEAPVVILADSNKIPNLHEDILIYDEQELPIMLAMSGGQKKHFGVFKQTKQQYDAAKWQEYWRLLYVALTRACDELHIFAHSKAKDDNWYGKLLQQFNGLPNVVLHDDGVKEYCIDEVVQAEDVLAQSPTLSMPIFNAPNKPPQRAFRAVTSMATDNLIMNDAAKILPSIIPAKIKGNIIHALLQRQVNLPYAEFLQAAPQILPHIAKSYGLELQQAQKEELLAPLMAILAHNELVALLEQLALAELPMVGMLKNNAAVAQIDRVIFNDETLHIIDFKTGEGTVTDATYHAQLLNYQQLMQKLYPQKAISTSLFYVNSNPKLIAVDN
jgi:ATP-dependent helicase/nuclease subunit A